ncbi:MAG: pirin family protein [Candidatus Zixiibacteriota bacterium]
MIDIRKSADRGYFDHGWLKTYHSFSFADYYDENHMGFRTLRVINQDVIRPEYGFGMHPHRDMEIITVVISGALTHKDSTGTEAIIRPGDIQRMTAGQGIVHSEINESESEPVHLLQIWILPDEQGRQPEYEQKTFSPSGKENRLRLIASPDGRDDSVTIHQDVLLHESVIQEGIVLSYDFGDRRFGWIQLLSGKIEVNGHRLEAGDGASISGESRVDITGMADSEFLLFDLD